MRNVSTAISHRRFGFLCSITIAAGYATWKLAMAFMKRCPIPRVCTPEPLNWGRPVYQHPGGTFRWREPFSDEEAPMDANSGEPWSEMDITDLKHSVEYGEHDRTDCELPVPRRGRGPREDNGTWVAPDKRRVVISRITTAATPLEVATHDPSRTKKERYPGAAQKKSPAGKRGLRVDEGLSQPFFSPTKSPKHDSVDPCVATSARQ
jgi:hypothetical protein